MGMANQNQPSFFALQAGLTTKMPLIVQNGWCHYLGSTFHILPGHQLQKCLDVTKNAYHIQMIDYCTTDYKQMQMLMQICKCN